MSTIPDPGRRRSTSRPPPRALRRRARLRRDPRADRHRRARRRARASARPSSPTASASRAAPCARRCGGSRETGSSSSRSTGASSSPTPGSTTSATGSRRAWCSSRGSRGSQRRGARSLDLEAMLETIEAELAARTSDAAHDASRAFHVAVAAATREPGVREAPRRALDRRHRPTAPRPAAALGGVAGQRRRGAPCDRRGDRGRRRRPRRGADAGARRERLPALVATRRRPERASPGRAHSRARAGCEQLCRQRLAQPALELVGRPATLADEQEPDVGVVERPEDVGRPVGVEAAAEPSRPVAPRRSRAGSRRSRSRSAPRARRCPDRPGPRCGSPRRPRRPAPSRFASPRRLGDQTLRVGLREHLAIPVASAIGAFSSSPRRSRFQSARNTPLFVPNTT